MNEIRYTAAIKWTGNKGSGTSHYRTYERSYTVSVENKPVLNGSTDYTDNASCILSLNEDHSGHFSKILLNPVVTITDESKTQLAKDLHKEARKFCFAANSLNFKIEYNPEIKGLQ